MRSGLEVNFNILLSDKVAVPWTLDLTQTTILGYCKVCIFVTKKVSNKWLLESYSLYLVNLIN